MNDLTKSFLGMTGEPQWTAWAENRTELYRADHGIDEMKVPVERIQDSRHKQKRNKADEILQR